ncbi:uncharacterized protein YALI1_B00819g [Yarrowia lipolytica]|uniref:Uncharacterized protein n=1 Tax=Yarrowia lipolytica TaxID=4952 RepID=A0A1D8N5V4_YARLL|nr:hypothetical protein YALI1_B00819g [Yarrowia lipolytica]
MRHGPAGAPVLGREFTKRCTFAQGIQHRSPRVDKRQTGGVGREPKKRHGVDQRITAGRRSWKLKSPAEPPLSSWIYSPCDG